MPVADVIRRKRRERLDQVLQFPENLGAHAMLLQFKKYDYIKPGERKLNKVDSSTLSRKNLESSTNILLPLPQNIQDSYQVRVARFEQGFLGPEVSAAAAELGKTGNDPTLGQLASVISKGMPNVKEEDIRKVLRGEMGLGEISRAAAFLGRRTLEAIPGIENISRNIDAGFGNILNPKAALYFEGVELKSPNFNWVFAPASENESNIIRDIGNAIKRNILPSYGETLGFQKALLNYPAILDIFFFGIDQSYFVHYKSCMVQQFNIDFSPQGLAFVKGGKPAMVNMNMIVIETDIHTAENYTEGAENSVIS